MSSNLAETQAAGLSRQYAKACELGDFSDPELAEAIQGIVPDNASEANRKWWEFAMCGLFLRDVGCMRDDAAVLDLAAGREQLVFWLTNNVGRVVAADIYGLGKFSENEAPAAMLTDPAQYAPYPFREDTLEVVYQDARQPFGFADDSFDAIVSCSSIEHFGSAEQTRAAMREVGRVLRPGGHALLITELFVRHSPVDRAPVHFAVRLLSGGRRASMSSLRKRHALDEVFTLRELQRDVIDASGLRLMQPLTLSVSPATWSNVTTILPDGQLAPSSGQRLPHILLKVHRSVFTSVCLPLEKPA